MSLSFADLLGLDYAAAAHPPLHQQLRDAGQALAGQITAGEMAALTPNTRYELTALSLALAGWADTAEAIQQATRGRTLREFVRQPRVCMSCGGEVA
jgi:uncharacterized protein RhaS with RHS repeats